MVNEKSTLKELEQQAKNTKLYVDRLVKANTGLTLEEILRLGLREERPEGDGDERSVENDLLGAELQTAAGQKIISKVIDADGDPARSYADGDRHLPLLQVDARHLLFRTQPIPSERRRTKVKPNKWLLIANLIAEILLAIKVLTMR